MPTDFPGAFAALRRILLAHRARLIVQTDTPERKAKGAAAGRSSARRRAT